MESNSKGAPLKIARYISIKQVVIRLMEMGYNLEEYNEDGIKLFHPESNGNKI